MKVLHNHHLRNASLGSLSAAMTRYMKVKLKDDLDVIDTILIVYIAIDKVVINSGKCVGLTKNYPKGSGDIFIAFIEECHPGSCLLHLKETRGDRQDIVCETSGPAHVNRKFHFDFLDCRMKSEGKESMLEDNFLIFMSSVPITALCVTVSIFYLAGCVLMRWTCGNSHALAECGLSVKFIDRLIYKLEENMIKLEDDSNKILQEDFIMSLFDDRVKELPHLKDSLVRICTRKKQTRVV